MGNAFAVGENIVASKSYVDTKQVKLHTANANPANNGTTVVTYTDTEGTPGERGIFDFNNDVEYDNETDLVSIVQGHEGDLVTASDLVPLYNGLEEFEDTVSLMTGQSGTVVVRDNSGRPYASRNIFDFNNDVEYDNETNLASIVQEHEGDLVTASDFMLLYNGVSPMFGQSGTVVVRDNSGQPYASRNIYDGSTEYDEQDNADDLVTAGAVANTLPTGTADTVVTYNDDGKIGGERGIYDGGNYDASTDANKLVTASVVNDLSNHIEHLPLMETTKLVCANPNDGCTLWTMQSQLALQGTGCLTGNDCESGYVCTNNVCVGESQR